MSSAATFLPMLQPGRRGCTYCPDHCQVPHGTTLACPTALLAAKAALSSLPLFSSTARRAEPSPSVQGHTIEAPHTPGEPAEPAQATAAAANPRGLPVNTLEARIPRSQERAAKAAVNISPANTEEEGGTPLEGPMMLTTTTAKRHNHNAQQTRHDSKTLARSVRKQAAVLLAAAEPSFSRSPLQEPSQAVQLKDCAPFITKKHRKKL